MRWLSWLMGKKEPVAVENKPKQQEPLPRAPEHAVTPPAPTPPKPPSEADNLRRWKESGRPRAWVEAHHGRWDHAQWLALLEELKHSPFWPMQPDAVGAVLEEARRELLRRN